MIEIINAFDNEVEDDVFAPTFEDDTNENQEEVVEENEDDEETIEQAKLDRQHEEEEQNKESAPIEETEDEEEDEIAYPTIAPFVSFEDAIKMGMESMAETDEELANALKKENKSYKECVDYVMNYVSKNHSGNKTLQLSDAVVFDICKFYFLNDNAKVVEKPKGVTGVASNPNFQKALDGAAKKAKKLTKKELKKQKEEEKAKEHERIKAIAAATPLPSHSGNKERPKVFSGAKKGSAEYNKRLNEQVSLSIGFDFDD